MTRSLIAVLGGALAIGCAHSLAVATGGAGGSWVPDRFWPPPPATSLWTSAPCGADATLGDLAEQVRTTLAGAGYTDQRWVAIGSGYRHGFAVSTRLERSSGDGERFSPRHEHAASLLWLEGARAFTVPAPGRYRVLLVTVTDLPFERPLHRAPIWSADTWIGEAPPEDFPGTRRASQDTRIGVYTYDYATDEGQTDAELVVSSGVRAERAGVDGLPCRE